MAIVDEESRRVLPQQVEPPVGTDPQPLVTVFEEDTDVVVTEAGGIRRIVQMANKTATINAARKVYVLGVGMANPVALNFAYLGTMALDNVTAIPRDGSQPVDSLIRAGQGDVLIAMTFKPYRREVVEAVEAAAEQGVEIIAISDSPAAPHFTAAKHRFEVPVSGPQFFTSTVALTAFLETLMAFVIAGAPAKAVQDIDRFHERRHRLGIYVEES